MRRLSILLFILLFPALAFGNQESDRLKSHFESVEAHLRATDVSDWPTSKQQARKHTLDALRRYRSQARFPKNTNFSDTNVPAFIDENGNRCAVAYLMEESGFEETAADIQATQNFAWVPEFQHPELTNWLDYVGLTAEEATWIQPSYVFCIHEAELFEPTTTASCGETLSLAAFEGAEPSYEESQWPNGQGAGIGCFHRTRWSQFAGPSAQFLTHETSSLAEIKLPDVTDDGQEFIFMYLVWNEEASIRIHHSVFVDCDGQPAAKALDDDPLFVRPEPVVKTENLPDDVDPTDQNNANNEVPDDEPTPDDPTPNETNSMVEADEDSDATCSSVPSESPSAGWVLGFVLFLLSRRRLAA